ncbi:MAG: hypothetical protein D3908_11310, partial [Candidatus Electrothrix sp. AUS4]|nr:hypothetical protein [Candidatus Electrothrix sp. AUS4]
MRKSSIPKVVSPALQWLAAVLFLLLQVSCDRPQPEKKAQPQDVATQSLQADTLVLAIGGEEEQGYDPTLGWG